MSRSSLVRSRSESVLSLVGTSSGANVIAALQLAQKIGPRATVVTLLCDRAERYFSTPLFASPENQTALE